MSVGTVPITAEEFAGIAEEKDGLCELVRGEVRDMTRPSFRHGGVCANISGEIRDWGRSARRGRVITNDAGVLTERDPDTVRGPDVYYISHEKLPVGTSPRLWLDIPPDLCVEVLSPSDRWRDVLDKVTEYLEFGVPEVWIADPEEKRLHVYRSDAAPVIFSGDEAIESRQLSGFQTSVATFFEGC